MTRSGTLVVAVVVVLAVVPAGIALSSPHLAAAPGLLVLSTTAAALAVGVLAAQPWLSRRRPRPGRRPCTWCSGAWSRHWSWPTSAPW